MKPTLYVEVRSSYSDTNPIAQAIRTVTTAFGAEQVDELVRGDDEADIAVANTIDIALRLMKETERTSIVLVYFKRDEEAQAVALASRFPDRMFAVAIIGGLGEPSIVPFLAQLIAKKTKE